MQQDKVQNFVSCNDGYTVTITRLSNTQVFRSWTSAFFFFFFLVLKKQLIVWVLSVYSCASVYMYDNRNSQTKPNWARWIGLMSGHPWVCPHQTCSSDQWCAFEANLSIFPVLWFGFWSSLLSSHNGFFLDETKPEDVVALIKGI